MRSVMYMLRPKVPSLLSGMCFHGVTLMFWMSSGCHLNSSGILRAVLTFCTPRSRSITRWVSSSSLLPTQMPLAKRASHLPRPAATRAEILCQTCSPISAISPLYSLPYSILWEEPPWLRG